MAEPTDHRPQQQHSQATAAPLFDLKAAAHHCRLIGLEPQQAHLRALHWNGGGARDLPPGQHNPQQLEQLQQQGYRLYVIAGGGRNKDAVEEIPAVFAEWDDLLLEDVEALLHEAQLQGLPEHTLLLTTWQDGSAHVWWRLDQPCTDIDRWRRLMDRLVVALGSDPACTDPSRLMRLAGSAYIAKAKDPRRGQVLGQARILHDDPDATTTLEELEQWVEAQFQQRPELAEQLKESSEASDDPPTEAEREERRKEQKLPPLPPARSLKEIKAALDLIPRRGAPGPNGETTGGPYRWPYHRLVACGVRDALYRHNLAVGLDEEEAKKQAHEKAVELMDGHSPSKEGGWRVAQVLATSKWLDEGNLWSRAAARGYDLSGPVPPPDPISTEELQGAKQLPRPQDPEDLAVARAATHRQALNLTQEVDLRQVLPPQTAGLVTARAAAFPCNPLAMLGPLLVAVASIIGTRARARVKRGWEEPLVVWVVNILNPSALKTPATEVCSRPLYEIEAEARRAHAAELREAEEAAADGDKREVDPPRRYVVDDVTYEKVAQLVAEPRTFGLATMSDELAAWFANLDRRESAARAGWLKFWSGGPAVVDRKVADSSFAIRTSVSLFGNTQPDKYQELVSRGVGSLASSGDGLFSRFLPCHPRTVPWAFNDHEITIGDDIRALLEKLNECPAGDADDVRLGRPGLLLPLTPEAKAAAAPVWDRWAAEAAESNPGRAAFIGKLRGYSVRIAAVLHLLALAEAAVVAGRPLRDHLTQPTDGPWLAPIGPEEMGRSFALCHYYLRQFDALQADTGAGEVPPLVAKFLRKAVDKAAAEVNPRDLVHWRIRGRDTMTTAEAETFLRGVAEEHGWGELKEATRGGRCAWVAPAGLASALPSPAATPLHTPFNSSTVQQNPEIDRGAVGLSVAPPVQQPPSGSTPEAATGPDLLNVPQVDGDSLNATSVPAQSVSANVEPLNVERPPLQGEEEEVEPAAAAWSITAHLTGGDRFQVTNGTESRMATREQLLSRYGITPPPAPKKKRKRGESEQDPAPDDRDDDQADLPDLAA